MGWIRTLSGLRGSGLKTRLMHPVDELWDAWLGVSTSGYEAAFDSGSIHYEPTPYSVVRAVLSRIELGAGDVLVDIGCGLGRPLFFAAGRYPLARAVGIELNPALVERGIANVERMRRARCPVEIKQIPAQDYGFPDVTAIFMYHPFWRDAMRAVLERIRESLEANPRSLRIAYLNPMAEDELARCPWLERFDQWECSRVRSLNVAPDASVGVAFWRTR